MAPDDTRQYIEITPSTHQLDPTAVTTHLRRMHALGWTEPSRFWQSSSPPTVEILLVSDESEELTYLIGIDDPSVHDGLERILRGTFPSSYELTTRTVDSAVERIRKMLRVSRCRGTVRIQLPFRVLLPATGDIPSPPEPPEVTGVNSHLKPPIHPSVCTPTPGTWPQRSLIRPVSPQSGAQIDDYGDRIGRARSLLATGASYRPISAF